MSITIKPLTQEHFDTFISLVKELAHYEKLDPPSADAVERLRSDAFATAPRFNAALAFDADNKAVGYAIYFETYSSFLAKPTIYLEDLFVLESDRLKGAGNALFMHVQQLGKDKGCGRMEWQVLDWNQLARDFYHRKQGKHLEEWLTYRITY